MSTCGGTPPRDKYASVIIDVTRIADKAAPSRLLGLLGGSPKKGVSTCLQARTPGWQDGVDVVPMDGS